MIARYSGVDSKSGSRSARYSGVEPKSGFSRLNEERS